MKWLLLLMISASAYGITINEARNNVVEACKFDSSKFKHYTIMIDQRIEQDSSVGDTFTQFVLDEDGALAHCQIMDMYDALTKHYKSKGFQVSGLGGDVEIFGGMEIGWQ